MQVNGQYESLESYRSHIGSPKLRDFLQNVFKQVYTDKFMAIFKEVAQSQNSGQVVYETLLGRVHEAKGGMITRLRMGLQALSGERSTLAENIVKVMDPKQPKNGYVEIGMPGRMIRSLKKICGLEGRITVINEQESLVQSGFPRPYHDFHKLTYDPLPLSERSVDLISCFAGLHHCPPEKLNQFINSIHSTLREGGAFLVREHDAKDDEMQALAGMVHSVFNVASDVSSDDESKEVRNFKSVADWTKLLEQRGFKRVYTDQHLVRQGDSSENVLMKFVKVGSDPLPILREKLTNHYIRYPEQTHLTTVEWFNVESSQNLGSVENFWDYAYLRDVKELWTNFYHSMKAGRRASSIKKLATSDYTLMNVTILTMMTTEYVAKGILYTPFWALSKINSFLPQGKKDAAWEKPAQFYQEWLEQYGKSLEVTPYYAQRYLPAIKNYWEGFAAAAKQRGIVKSLFDRQTIKNIVTGAVMSIDMITRAANATLINKVLGGEEAADERQIGLIIKGNATLSPQLKTFQEDAYTGIIAPRYKELQNLLTALSKQNGVELIEIAGQTQIQIDVIVDKSETSFGSEKLYERACLADGSKKVVALKVDIKDLLDRIKNHQVMRVCDF